MFSIGDFARIGRVSIRMLRHYDTVGLLRPARVDPATGYRYYEAAQLSRLNRLIALKDLGFTLQQVGQVLDDKVSVAELHGMLRLRQAELEAQVVRDRARLVHVEARIRTIEREGVMPADIVVKSVPAVRVAELTGIAESYESEHIGPVIQPLYPELHSRMEKAGVALVGPGIAYYEQVPEGVLVHAGFPVAVAPSDAYDFAVVDLPPIEQAATILHHGPMDDVGSSHQQLARWVEENGYRSVGFTREVYLEYGMGDPSTWVTELQESITPA
ncbi:MerR family transcriptional regulator [Acrocarpospora phusangensis]|uniref:MerR family transcriptional regulator n=1 Tax=Acrocarpospora phusangensis TaxID=1070424 RepID=A0A919UNV1_9ACTN|nr:MerR family transcriptional regulator [Acrocarpospora phusangensis]GIH28264.1 MerR family transcriptional regulator [Acrocarpospora phusangensis]